MKHNVDGRKFGRNTSHRTAMFRNMANAIIEREQVVTSVQKAKEMRRIVDRLITLGKSGTPASRRLAFNRTRNAQVVQKLFGVLAERYNARPGGYTRVLKLAQRRWGDAAEMAVIELVDHPPMFRGKRQNIPAYAALDGIVAEPVSGHLLEANSSQETSSAHEGSLEQNASGQEEGQSNLPALTSGEGTAESNDQSEAVTGGDPLPATVYRSRFQKMLTPRKKKTPKED